MEILTSPVYLGSAATAPGYGLRGYLDNLQIWNYARTEQQLKDSITNLPNGNEEGLMGYWNFDNIQNGVVPDLTEYGNNGFINPPISTPEPVSMLLFGIGGWVLALLRKKRS